MKAFKLTLSVIAAAMFISCGSPKSDFVKASEDVIVRAIGSLDGITLQEIPSEGGKDCYEICGLPKKTTVETVACIKYLLKN